MSIAAIGTVVTTGVAATALSRPEPAGDNPAQTGAPPDPPERVEAPQPEATVTTLSDEARAQQAAAEPAPAAAASTSTLSDAVSSDWAAGVPAVDDAAVQDALTALDEASRDNAQAAIDAEAARQRDEVDLQQKAAVAAAVAAEDKRQDAIVLAALNAGIRLAYGAMPSPLSGDPVLRAPGHLDVIV